MNASQSERIADLAARRHRGAAAPGEDAINVSACGASLSWLLDGIAAPPVQGNETR